MRTYTYAFTMLTVNASNDGEVLTIKQGMRTFTVQLRNLTMFYVHKVASGVELLVSTTQKNGKQKVQRFYANEGEAEFGKLVDDLAAQFPQADLRPLDEASALAKMKAANTDLLALFSVPLVILAIMVTLVMPQIRHAIDSGQATLTVGALAETRGITTRNVTVKGLFLDKALEETTTRKGTTTRRCFIPIVDAKDPNGPVRVIVQTGALTDAEYSALLKKEEISGMVRNVMWEGLSSKQRDFFAQRVKLAPDALLVEANATPASDGLVAALVVGVTALIMFAVTGFMFVKRKREQS